MKEKNKGGRPTKWTQEIENEILVGLANGIPLTAICSRKGFPVNICTVFYWEEIIPGFSNKITRAREKSADYYSHQIIEIADEKPMHKVPDPDGGVSMRIDPGGVQRNKLRIETRIKMMQMLKRKTYGEKTQVELSGEVGIKTVLVAPDAKDSTPRPELKPDFD